MIGPGFTNILRRAVQSDEFIRALPEMEGMEGDVEIVVESVPVLPYEESTRAVCIVEKPPIKFVPPYQMSYGEAWEIVKRRLDDESVSVPQKVEAIGIVTRMETLNSITKDELQNALRWLFDNYDF